MSTIAPRLVCLALALAAAPAVAQTTAHVTVRSQLPFPDDCTGAVAIDGNIAYIARAHDGVAVVDVSDPDAPSLITTIVPEVDTSRFFVVDVAAVDGRLYIGNRVPNGTNLPTGIYVYDVTNPAAPARIGEMTWGQGGGYHFGANVEGFHVDVTGQGQHILYAVSRTTGMIEVFDFTQAAAPGYVITLPISCDYSQYPNLPPECFEPRPGYAADAIVRDGILYSAMGSGGVIIHDVTDPYAPVFLHHIEWAGADADEVELSDDGDTLFVVEQRSTGYLRSFDVSTPAAPIALDTFRGRARSIPGRIDVDGDLAFLTHHEDGVYVLDVSDPADLRPVGLHQPRAAAPNYGWVGHEGVFAAGRLAFVTDSDTGLEVIELDSDQITISKADYRRGQQKLVVRATTDAAPSAFYTPTVDGYGPMSWNNNKQRWQLVLRGVAEPATITVRSPLGAVMTTAVRSRR